MDFLEACLTLASANDGKVVDFSKMRTITMIMMTITMMTTISVAHIQPMRIPRFLQTLRLFRQVSFAASVPRKLCKAQNFATAAEQPLR